MRTQLLLSMALTCGGWFGTPPAAQEATQPVAAASTIEFRISPIIDLHMELRAVRGIRGGEHPWLAPYNDLERAIGGERGWLWFEANLEGCDTAAQLMEAFKQLPMNNGEHVLQGPAIAYARALGEMEPDFLANRWPARMAKLEELRTRLESELLPHAGKCLDRIMKSLDMTDPSVVIPVYLTLDGPFPGASTSANIDNRGVCFIALSSCTGSHAFETVLHEATHALDVATREQDHALNVMRAKLVEASVPRTDRRWRDAWHTIMFIQAADTVRTIIDPTHIDYGDAAKYYDKVPEVAAIERPIWSAYLKGELKLADAIQRIVEQVAAIQAR